MLQDDLACAINEWHSLLSEKNVITKKNHVERYCRNITEFNATPIPAVLIPANKEQVIGIVQIANKYKVSIYPVSTGKNWGLGSCLPAKEGSVLVIMSALNKIVEVNERLRYAVIEPGVTQKQLSDYLISINSSLILNVTGSAKDTSIIGNTLERGAGVYGQRSNQARNMEVLLANGEIVRTGFWHFNSANPVHYYNHGTGPDINGIFTQSNLGIVLSMSIGLLPRKQVKVACFSLNEKMLPSLIDALFYLKEDNLIEGGPVILNRFDHRVNHSPKSDIEEHHYMVVTTLAGVRNLLPAVQKEFETRIKNIINGEIQYYDNKTLDEQSLNPFIRAALSYFSGTPLDFSLDCLKQLSKNKSDIILEDDNDLDNNQNTPGFSCVLPAVPFVGDVVQKILTEIKAVSTQFPFNVAYSFVALNNFTLEGFIRIHFDRNNKEEVKKAHEWNKIIHKELQKLGILPYRVNIKQMPDLVNRENDTFWETIKVIKTSLDPNNIISPGRYCPD